MHRQSNVIYADNHLKTTYFAASVIPELLLLLILQLKYTEKLFYYLLL